MPAIPHDVPAGPSRLGELRREPLDPPVHRHVIDLDPALGEELFHVTVGEAEPQVPPHRQGDDLGREPVSGEGRTRCWSGARAWVRSHGGSLPDAVPRPPMQQSSLCCGDAASIPRAGCATFARIWSSQSNLTNCTPKRKCVTDGRVRLMRENETRLPPCLWGAFIRVHPLSRSFGPGSEPGLRRSRRSGRGPSGSHPRLLASEVEWRALRLGSFEPVEPAEGATRHPRSENHALPSIRPPGLGDTWSAAGSG